MDGGGFLTEEDLVEILKEKVARSGTIAQYVRDSRTYYQAVINALHGCPGRARFSPNLLSALGVQKVAVYQPKAQK